MEHLGVEFAHHEKNEAETNKRTRNLKSCATNDVDFGTRADCGSGATDC